MSGKIGLPPLARVKEVGRQQQPHKKMEITILLNKKHLIDKHSYLPDERSCVKARISVDSVDILTNSKKTMTEQKDKKKY